MLGEMYREIYLLKALEADILQERNTRCDHTLLWLLLLLLLLRAACLLGVRELRLRQRVRCRREHLRRRCRRRRAQPQAGGASRPRARCLHDSLRTTNSQSVSEPWVDLRARSRVGVRAGAGPYRVAVLRGLQLLRRGRWCVKHLGDLLLTCAQLQTTPPARVRELVVEMEQIRKQQGQGSYLPHRYAPAVELFDHNDNLNRSRNSRCHALRLELAVETRRAVHAVVPLAGLELRPIGRERSAPLRDMVAFVELLAERENPILELSILQQNENTQRE